MSKKDTAPPLDARPVELEIFIPKILRVGLLAATAFMAVGLVLLAAGVGAGSSAVPFSLGNLPALLAAADPRGFIGLGIVVLLGTPLVRVVASLAYFAREKDRLYMVLTALVLGNLALAVAIGAI